jgi:hypothetical protein
MFQRALALRDRERDQLRRAAACAHRTGNVLFAAGHTGDRHGDRVRWQQNLRNDLARQLVELTSQE